MEIWDAFPYGKTHSEPSLRKTPGLFGPLWISRASAASLSLTPLLRRVHVPCRHSTLSVLASPCQSYLFTSSPFHALSLVIQFSSPHKMTRFLLTGKDGIWNSHCHPRTSSSNRRRRKRFHRCSCSRYPPCTRSFSRHHRQVSAKGPSDQGSPPNLQKGQARLCYR